MGIREFGGKGLGARRSNAFGCLKDRMQDLQLLLFRTFPFDPMDLKFRSDFLGPSFQSSVDSFDIYTGRISSQPSLPRSRTCIVSRGGVARDCLHLPVGLRLDRSIAGSGGRDGTLDAANIFVVGIIKIRILLFSLSDSCVSRCRGPVAWHRWVEEISLMVENRKTIVSGGEEVGPCFTSELFSWSPESSHVKSF
jgi:hypothetical protein